MSNVLAGLAATVCLALGVVPTPAFAQTRDCAGPAGDPEPGTPEWDQRDRDNQYCAEERHADHAQHPVLAPVAPFDQYRVPARHDDVRFRYALVAITNRDGETIEAEIYAPCKTGSCPNLPPALRTFEPPYPGAVIIHGGGSRKELHWWSSQPLAEAGYLVVALDTVSSLSGHRPDTEDVIDWFFATPASPTGHGEFNPFWQEFDGEPIGIAGHSAGGVAVNVIGHADARVGAIASWDRAQSSPIPPEREVSTPTIFFMADLPAGPVLPARGLSRAAEPGRTRQQGRRLPGAAERRRRRDADPAARGAAPRLDALRSRRQPLCGAREHVFHDGLVRPLRARRR